MAKNAAILFIVGVCIFIFYSSADRAAEIVLEPNENGIDLSTTIPGDWDRLCILFPYTTNLRAKQVLGVAVNVESKSDISWSDSIALFVTTKASKVENLFDVSRKNIDFTKLGGQCFAREDTRFTLPQKGHHFAVHSQ